MMPRWMSLTELNSGVPLAQWPLASEMPVCLPRASTQVGVTSLLTSTGTASARISCLSAIDSELSIMNSRSTLSTAWLVMVPTYRFVVEGCAGAAGRSRQPVVSASTGKSAVVARATQAAMGANGARPLNMSEHHRKPHASAISGQILRLSPVPRCQSGWRARCSRQRALARQRAPRHEQRALRT